MIIQKFGGTSVEDAAAINAMIGIVERERARTPLIVLSAIAGATNTLLKAARTAQEGRFDDANALLNDLLERHVVILENLIDARPRIQGLLMELRRRFEELRHLCQGIALLGELTDRSLDTVASYGERLSSRIVAETMDERGFPVKLVDARSFMITDDRFTAARPRFDEIHERLNASVRPLVESGTIVVTQGFIGATRAGVTTTLGRGGSDFTASIIGAALDAREIQVWTDVDGVLTADPRICPDARQLGMLSFREASELAYFGARVLHPSTILPAVQKAIPVRVLNSRHPELPGTLICPTAPPSDLPVKSIASKKGITVINIQSTRMLMAYGFLERIFSVFNRAQTPVDLVTTSEVAVSVTIDTTEHLEDIVAALSEVGEVSVYERKAILCIVGEQMHATSGVADRVFRALRDFNVLMISQGASEVNMSVVLDDENIVEAVRRLHAEFFPAPVPGRIAEPVRNTVPS